MARHPRRVRGGTEQLEAHWLAWLGAAVLLVTAAIGIRQGGRAANLGTAAVLAGSAAYVLFAAWHFYEHAQHRDPEVLHLVIVAAQVVMLGGVPAALVLARRPAHARSSARTR